MQELISIRDDDSIRAVGGGMHVSAGQGVDAERAHDCFELLFVAGGVLRLREGGTPCRLEQDQAFLILPGSVHRIFLPERKGPAFYWVLFHAEEGGGRPRERLLTLPKSMKVSRPDRMVEILRWYLDDLRTDGSSRRTGSRLVALMLDEMARAAEPDPAIAAGRGSLADRVLVCIACRYGEKIGTSDIAMELRYNPDYLERVFREATGISITEAITRKRLKEARRRLLHGNGTVDEIALRCGFHDSGYFRRVFKRHAGMAPGRYRELYGRMLFRID